MVLCTHFRDARTGTERTRSPSWSEGKARTLAHRLQGQASTLCALPLILTFPIRSLGLSVYIPNVIQLTSDRTSTRSSDFKSRGIVNILKARNLKFGEKSNVTKEVMMLRSN